MATFKKFRIWDLSTNTEAKPDDNYRVINIEHIIEVKGAGIKGVNLEVYWITLVNREWFTTTTAPNCEVKELIFGKE